MDKTKKVKTRTGRSLSQEERKKMIAEYLTGRFTKKELWYKYTGQYIQHGQMNNWMRKLGYTQEEISEKLVKKVVDLPMKIASQEPIALNQTATVEELTVRIKQLEKQLENSRLKEEGYLLMIEIAEQEYKIPVRKKLNTK
jgi:transposase